MKSRLIEHEKGSAFLEAAITLPVALFLLLGVIDVFSIQSMRGKALESLQEASRNALINFRLSVPMGDLQKPPPGFGSENADELSYAHVEEIRIFVDEDPANGNSFAALKVTIDRPIQCLTCALLPASLLSPLSFHKSIIVPLT